MLVTFLLMGATACGEGQTEAAKVAGAYNAVVEALVDQDYEEACEGLTDGTRQDLRKAAMIEQTDGCGATLERVIAEVGVEQQALADVASSDVEIKSETSAMVNDIRMLNEGGTWRLEGDLDFVRPFLSGGSLPQ